MLEQATATMDRQAGLPDGAPAAAGAGLSRASAFSLYPPRSARGLDPQRPDAFARRLAAFHAHHASLADSRANGGLFVIDIGELRRRFAKRWIERQEKAYQLIEGCLERRLGRHDLYVAIAGDRFLVLLTDLDRQAAERQARRLGAEITDRVCGMLPGGVACRIETTTFDLDAGLAGVASLAELEESLALCRQPADDPVARHAAVLGQHLRAVRVPVWHARKRLFSIDAVIAVSDGGADGFALPVEEAAIVALDCWTVAAAAQLLQASAARRAPLVELHYATLATMRHRQLLMLACRRLPARARARLLLEVSGLPAHLPQARVQELMSYLKPFALGIVVRLDARALGQPGSASTGIVEQLANTGIAGLSLDLADSAGVDVARALALLGHAARCLGLRTFCRLAAGGRLVDAAIAARIDHLAFPHEPRRDGPSVRTPVSATPG